MRATRWLFVLSVLVGVAWLLPTFQHGTLADSLTFRIKERMFSGWSAFDPAQTEVINPYWRPLFMLLHGAFDRALPDRDLGLRVLALACHVAAMLALAGFARGRGLSPVTIAAAVLLFALVPGNVFTASWPIVGYWSLAAALSLTAARLLWRYQECGGRGSFAGGVALAAVSLLCAETTYFLVPLAGWWLLIPGPGGAGPRRRRALMCLAVLATLSAIHFRLLESSAQGLVEGPSGIASVTTLLSKVVSNAPAFWAGTLGGDRMTGRPEVALLFGALVLLGVLSQWRSRLALAGAVVLAVFPFAAIGHSDRYAYFASGLLSLVTADALLRGLPAWAGERPTARRALGIAGGIAFATLLGLSGWQATLRLAETQQAAAQTTSLGQDIESHREQLQRLDRVAFINLPPFMKWKVFDVLGISTQEALDQRWAELRNLAVFTTKHSYFHLAPTDLSATCDVVYECDGARLIERDPAHPLGDRTALAPPWFLAADYEVLAPPSDGPRAALAHRDRMLERTDSLADPRQLALLETEPAGLVRPLATTGAQFTFEPEPPPDEADGLAGIRLPGRLVVDLHLDRPGLVVVITWFGAEDPVHRVAGDVGRFCRHIEAFLDGQPVDIQPVYHHCTGVVVPAGRHRLIVRQRRPGQALPTEE